MIERDTKLQITDEPAIAYSGMQLYAVVCRLSAVEKLRIGAVIRWHGLLKR